MTDDSGAEASEESWEPVVDDGSVWDGLHAFKGHLSISALRTGQAGHRKQYQGRGIRIATEPALAVLWSAERRGQSHGGHERRKVAVMVKV